MLDASEFPKDAMTASTGSGGLCMAATISKGGSEYRLEQFTKRRSSLL